MKKFNLPSTLLIGGLLLLTILIAFTGCKSTAATETETSVSAEESTTVGTGEESMPTKEVSDEKSDTKEESEKVSNEDISSTAESTISSQVKKQEPLSAEMERKIKQDYWKLYFEDDPYYANGYSYEDIKIHYYGTYNGCVVMFIDSYRYYTQAERTEEVAGITFYYSSGQGFEIWRNGEFFDLKSAYEQGFLTKADIEAIKGLD
jgi:hypothetical protein